MIRKHAALALCVALASVLPAAAKDEAPDMTPEQQQMMAAYQAAGTPGDAHAKLKAMEGDYDLVIRSWEGPGEPNVEKGKANRKMILGGRVMAEHVDAKMHGQAFTGHGMSGYDNVTGKHWSTWNDSMSTGVMVSEGTCDAAGTCAFTGSYNDPITKGRTTARMTTRWTSPTVEVFEMYAPGPDGKEAKMMEITYSKKS